MKARKSLDIAGNRYGLLTALSFKAKDTRNRHLWLCLCKCGNKRICRKDALLNGSATRCFNCLTVMRAKQAREDKPRTTHGMYYTRFHGIYRSILQRCADKTQKYYGAKGIKSLWRDFEHFKADMYESYLKHVEEFGEKDTTIDRRKSNRNYYKENCRWATKKEQSINRPNIRYLTFRGERLHMAEWARKQDIDLKLIHSRIKKGWSVERALTKKI